MEESDEESKVEEQKMPVDLKVEAKEPIKVIDKEPPEKD